MCVCVSHKKTPWFFFLVCPSPIQCQHHVAVLLLIHLVRHQSSLASAEVASEGGSGTVGDVPTSASASAASAAATAVWNEVFSDRRMVRREREREKSV